MPLIRTVRLGLALSSLLMLGGLMPGSADGQTPNDRREQFKAYREVVTQTANMVADADARRLTSAKGLDMLNVTWEDTGRFHNSAVGPNISDMTIQVQQIDPDTQQSHLSCMPVIRFPNFSDKSADLPIKKFKLLVGNEKKGDELRAISLQQYLGNFRKYLTNPNSWAGDETYLLADRDTHVLVSAQACFLPVPKQGMAEFNPVLFNYQSRQGDPAVLTILVTREGSSATIIDNHRDGFRTAGVWGQRLFHNKQGERCSLTGQRLSDFKANPDPGPREPLPKVGGEAGLNMVLLIQVPLQQKERPLEQMADVEKSAPAYKDKAPGGPNRRGSDVEEAVIGHGKVEGVYSEIDGLAIRRDPRFPIRVTVQFYKATSNGVVSAQDIDDIRKQIDKVYAEGDFVGSLVVGPQAGRPTEYDGDKVEPPDWWQKFWQDYHDRTGLGRAEVLVKLREQKGEKWTPTTEAMLSAEAEEFARTWVPPVGGGIPLTLYLAVAVGLAILAWLVVRQMPAATG